MQVVHQLPTLLGWSSQPLLVMKLAPGVWVPQPGRTVAIARDYAEAHLRPTGGAAVDQRELIGLSQYPARADHLLAQRLVAFPCLMLSQREVAAFRVDEFCAGQIAMVQASLPASEPEFIYSDPSVPADRYVGSPWPVICPCCTPNSRLHPVGITRMRLVAQHVNSGLGVVLEYQT